MHLYFYAANTAKKDLRDSYQQIKSTLAQTDVYVSTNTEAEQVQVSAEVLADMKQRDVPLLERMDAFLIEGTTSDPQVGFLLAHAIALKKPTLYLYQRGTVPQVFSHLTQKELPKFITVAAYREANVVNLVNHFLASIDGTKIRQVPRIKFTLRITNAIEEFLHFKTHNTKTTKADYLRERIEELMTEDADWQQHQRRRRA